MARLLYIDGFSGAAGDMLLGAFLDAGLPEAALREALGSLGVGHQLRIARVIRAGVRATKVDVVATDDPADQATGHAHPHESSHGQGHDRGGHAHAHPHDASGHRSLAHICHLIEHAAVSQAARTRAVSLFTRLAEAEAAIHNMPVDEVHLHEVGAVDSIIDIVGCVFALEWFGADRVVASSLNVGSGQVKIAHGTFPVPAPATLRLLAGVPIHSDGPAVELTTPTGALIVSDYAQAYGPLPAMTAEHIGYGAGTRDFPAWPNVVRVVVGQSVERPAHAATATSVVSIECEIDDMNPQLFGPLIDRLLAAGALDAFLTPVVMKKGRPGTLVTALAAESARAAVVDVLFRETTTIGVRFAVMERDVLERQTTTVSVRGTPIRIKVASRHGEVLGAMPEFEDCLLVAQSQGVPVKTIQAEAMRAWLDLAPIRP